MEKQQRKRGPPGKYARYICQRCRSRKIKCALPNPDDIRSFGSPLTEEKACERCRSLGLECIIEATVLGRPSHRRGPTLDARPYGGYLTTTTVDGSVSIVRSEENVSSPTISDVKEYFYTDICDNGADGDNVGERNADLPSRKSSNSSETHSNQWSTLPVFFLPPWPVIRLLALPSRIQCRDSIYPCWTSVVVTWPRRLISGEPSVQSDRTASGGDFHQ
jgi:hypothetical protein